MYVDRVLPVTEADTSLVDLINEVESEYSYYSSIVVYAICASIGLCVDFIKYYHAESCDSQHSTAAVYSLHAADSASVNSSSTVLLSNLSAALHDVVTGVNISEVTTAAGNPVCHCW